jgi:hypothetical protein
MPDQFVTQKGLPTERQILEQLRQQGIHNLDDLAREAVRHVQTETAGRMQAAPQEDFGLCITTVSTDSSVQADRFGVFPAQWRPQPLSCTS